MRFVFQVEVEVQRSEGKFATRDELGEQIREALEGADPGQVDGENGGQYETCFWDVSEVGEAPKVKARAQKKVEGAA